MYSSYMSQLARQSAGMNRAKCYPSNLCMDGDMNCMCHTNKRLRSTQNKTHGRGFPHKQFMMALKLHDHKYPTFRCTTHGLPQDDFEFLDISLGRQFYTSERRFLKKYSEASHQRNARGDNTSERNLSYDGFEEVRPFLKVVETTVGREQRQR